ncbi:MAG: hypothetical protein FWD69_07945 [Polyangiaceae bacterium]|nr:hypothetical protein [Polyangiaceae bacterium]
MPSAHKTNSKFGYQSIVAKGFALFCTSVFALAGLAVGASTARASPPAWSAEDALADGDIDAFDLTAPAARGGVLRAAPSGHAWLSILGFSRQWESGPHEIGGFVVLGLPLDRVAQANPRRAMSTSDPKPAPKPAQTPAPSQAPVSSTAPAALPLTVTPQFARACVASALRASGLGTDDAHVDAVISRARWSALLPELRLRAIRYDDQRLYTDTTTAEDAARLRDSASAQLSLEARLTWRLDRLVFAGDEPALERLRLHRQDARAHVAARALDALFHWQRASLVALSAEHDPNKSPLEQAELALHVMEAEATLDVLTNGWFSTWRRTLK